MGPCVPLKSDDGVGETPRVCSDLFPPSPLCSQQKTELPVTENVQTIPPPYVVRTILVYSRPPCQPQFSLTEPMKVNEAWERVVRHQEGLPEHKNWGTYRQVPRVQDRSWGIVATGARGELSPKG